MAKIVSFNRDAPAISGERRAKAYETPSARLCMTSEFFVLRGVTEMRSAVVHLSFPSERFERSFASKTELFRWLTKELQYTYESCEPLYEEMQKQRTLELPYLMSKEWGEEIGLTVAS